MDSQPLTLSSYPQAILHIDGDAFFASCEQASNPKLQGRPVVTGKERGIAASMSYEAKARGVVRGMRVADIRKAAIPADSPIASDVSFKTCVWRCSVIHFALV